GPAVVEAVSPAPTQEVGRPSKQRKEGLVAAVAPMVGTFFRAPAPDAPSYIEVGDYVKKNQVLCIIEAMKLMNEIESEFEGRVVEVLVKNEQPVGYGEELFLIEPT
ncbi:acetyl-CoA carboxylase biotin carboxyl carrier protein, partial [candidate division TA06 bacterium]